MHSKLLHKINESGIAGKLYDWLCDLLHDHSQFVWVHVNSKSSKVLSGVTLGSIFGPILFLIFINDICSGSDNHNVSVNYLLMILNGVVLIDYLTLQNHLNLIYKWSLDWQLDLSSTKCWNLSLNSSTCNPSYSIGNTLLNNVSSYNKLAVIIDHHLNFDCHVDQMCAKANKRRVLILRCIRSRDPVLLTKTFATYVRPILEYASLILFISCQSRYFKPTPFSNSNFARGKYV